MGEADRVEDLGGLYKLVRGRHGVYLANPRDQYMGRALITYGEFSEQEWRTLSQIIRPGQYVIEVGANIGAHTVSIAKQVGPGGRVLATEPQPILFQNLCANLALNSLVNVDAWNCANGRERAELIIPNIDYSVEGNYGALSMESLPQTRDGFVREIIPLDGLCRFPGVHVIKIDAEGMELDIIKGASQIISAHHPILYVENDRLEKSEALIRHLWDLGYRLWWDLPHYFNKDNFFAYETNIYGASASFNMVCMHKDTGSKVTGNPEITDAAVHPLKKG